MDAPVDFGALIPDLLAANADSGDSSTAPDAAAATDDGDTSTPPDPSSKHIQFVMNNLEGGNKLTTDNNGAQVRYGINQAANPDVNLKKLTPDAAEAIYRDRYWNKINGDNLPQEMQLPAISFAANAGTGQANKLIAQSGGDVNKFMGLQQNFYNNLAQNPKYAPQLPGWTDRLNKVQKANQAYIPTQNKQYAQADTGTQSDAMPDNTPPSGTPVTDPDLIKQLESAPADAPASGTPVTDPALLAQLEGDSSWLSGASKPADDAAANAPEVPFYGDNDKLLTPQASAQKAPDTFANRESQDWANSNKSLQDISQADASQPISSTMFQTAGNLSKRGVDLAGNTIGSGARYIGDAVPDDIKSGVNGLLDEIKDDVGGNLNPGVGQASDYVQAHPQLARNLDAAQNIAMAAPMLKPAAETLGAVGDSLKSGVKGVIDARESAPEYDPITTHSAISDAYGTAKKGTQPYYNLLNEIGAGENADASKLKPALDSMISDIQNTPFHEAQSELPYLKQQAAKIDDDGTMPLNDMVKLKQSLNSNFNPKRFAQGTDTPYAAVGNIVDNSLDDAAKRIPEFGEAKQLADKNWLNTVKAPFEDNKVLQKFWKPDDYYAKKSVDNGMLEELPDPTKARAATMLKNIKTPEQLNAVRRVLPQDLSDTLSQAKIDHVIQTEGAGRLASAGKAITGLPKIAISPLKGAGQVLTNAGRIISPDLTPEGKALINTAKTPKPSLSTKYQAPYQKLKTSLQQEKDLAGEMQPVSYAPKPKPLLQLPPPATVTPPPSAYEAATTNAQKEQLWSGRQAALAAQDKADKAAAEKMAASEMTKSQLADSLKAAKEQAEAKDEPLPAMAQAMKDAGFKKGGMVTPKFTHRQWTGYLQSGGKANGHRLKDKNSPEAQKKAYETTGKSHAAALKKSLGRDATVREIELAHYITPQGVVRVLKQKNGTMPAHKMFAPEVVKDMRKLFFNKNKPYSVDNIRKILT